MSSQSLTRFSNCTAAINMYLSLLFFCLYREAYSKLLSQLGQVGQDEIQRLENDHVESIL